MIAGFSLCGKLGVLKGHELTRAASASKTTRTLQAAEKLGVLKGHELTRAASAPKTARTLQAAEKLDA
jgi:hypothetical protein